MGAALLGIDNEGREVLTWISGDTATSGDDVDLVLLARIVRQLHDLTADLVEGFECVIHDDLQPRMADSGDGTVDRIDPATNKVVARIAVGQSPQAVAVVDGRAWVTVDDQTIRPVPTAKSAGTLRIDAQSDVDYMDPAVAYSPLSWQLLYATCAKLLNYPDRPGAAGSQLIPEVAQSLPAVSPDGRSYTFTIRPGFRFSPPSNDPVTAQTFKDTIERTLNPKMHSPVADEFADIPGYRDVHVYPLTPDPVKASQLAQGNGRTAVLYTCKQTTCEQDAQIVKTNLAAIGITVEVKTFPSNTLLARVATPGEPFDLAYTDGWEPDYLDPLAMLTEMTENSSVSPPFDDPTYRHQLAAAAQLSGPRRYLAFGQLDLDVARDSAPLVAYGNQYSSDFFSPRMGCQTFGPYGIDLAALCTKSRAR